MNDICDSVSVSLFAFASLCEVSWVRLALHQQMCLSAQAKGGWDKYDVQMAYEEDEYLTSQALRIPECGITKGWTKQVCQNKRSGSGLCKPRWFAVKIRHYEFGDVLKKIGCPMSHDKRYALVFAPNKEEAKATVENIAKEVHYRVWEGVDINDDFAYKLAVKPEYR